MVSLVARYFNLNKLILKVLGLWPFQQTKVVQLQIIFISGILAFAIIFQFVICFTSTCTLSFIIKSLSKATAFMMALMQYILFRIYIKTMKGLLTQVQCISTQLKKKEIKIMEKYGWYARCYTTVLLSLAGIFVSALLFHQFWPIIIHIILYKNISRPHRLQIKMEYFLDKENYFYFILLHVNVITLILILLVPLGIGTMFSTYFQYICGMFMIASYRIECAMRNRTGGIQMKNENLIITGIIRAVHMHRQAMQLCECFMRRFETFFFYLIILGVICLSLNLYQVFQITSFKETMDFMEPVVIIFVCISYMFLGNYMGQNITDHNNYIYITAYNSEWYKVSLQIQKLILFLLQRSVKTFTLSIAGLFDASNECFATLVKTSVSYFTVIYSTK